MSSPAIVQFGYQTNTEPNIGGGAGPAWVNPFFTGQITLAFFSNRMGSAATFPNPAYTKQYGTLAPFPFDVDVELAAFNVCHYFNPPNADGILHFDPNNTFDYDNFMAGVDVQVDGLNGTPPTVAFAAASSASSGLAQSPGPVAVSNGTYSISSAIAAGANAYWGAALVQINGTNPGDAPLLIAFLRSEGGFASVGVPGWTLIATGPDSGPVLTQLLFQYPGSGGGIPASDVVTDICERAGLSASQIDVSLLTNANIQPNVTVPGYLIEQPRPASEILKVLMQAYFFDGCESGGKMRWVPRGMSAAMTIPESDLGLMADKSEIEESLAQAQDLPLQMTVIHDDPVLDYQQNKQLKVRNTRIVTTRQNIVLRIPMTMDANWARQVAEKALYLAWLERSSYKMNLWRALYLLLDPTDVVQFVYEGVTFTMRVTENTIGQGYVIELKGANENSNNYLSSAQGGTIQGYTPAPATSVAATQVFLFDIPLLVDTDSNPDNTGFYFAGGSTAPNWAGAALYDSNDDSTWGEPVASTTSAVAFGVATTTLGAPRSPWEWDTVNTLTVALSSGQFAGDTAANVLNGSNVIVVGGEIVQFENAVQNSDGTWTLSMLLRGRRGTEATCGSHASNEFVLLVSSGLLRVQDPLSVLGQALYYKLVTTGQDISTAVAQQFTINGQDLKPYAPCHVGGTADGSGNITFTWLRRTRVGGEADWADGVADVPLSEDSEAYDVDIMNGSTVVRTVRVNAPTLFYSAAMQTTDFGSVQSSVTVNVYQISAQVGRGAKGTGSAPTAGGWPVPIPSPSSGYGQFYVNGS